MRACGARRCAWQVRASACVGSRCVPQRRRLGGVRARQQVRAACVQRQAGRQVACVQAGSGAGRRRCVGSGKGGWGGRRGASGEKRVLRRGAF